MVNECGLRERAVLTGLYISTGALLVLLLACSSRACQVAAAAAPRQGETRPQAVRRSGHYGSGVHALFHGHCRVGMHATVWCFVGGWRWFSVHENNRYGGSSTAVKAVCGAHMTRRYHGYLGSRSGAVRKRRLLKRGRKGRRLIKQQQGCAIIPRHKEQEPHVTGACQDKLRAQRVSGVAHAVSC